MQELTVYSVQALHGRLHLQAGNPINL
jgi:hypothetical protein